MYLNLPLLPQKHAATDEIHSSGRTTDDFYRAYLGGAGNQFAAVFGAMHDAPPGTGVIHCHLGKDRTGLIAALVQELCGLPRQEIAADYAETDQHLNHLYAAQLAAQPEPEKKAWLASFQVSKPADILAVLDYLDAQWGGARTYLEAFGFGRAEQEQLRRRLLRATVVP